MSIGRFINSKLFNFIQIILLNFNFKITHALQMFFRFFLKDILSFDLFHFLNTALMNYFFLSNHTDLGSFSFLLLNTCNLDWDLPKLHSI